MTRSLPCRDYKDPGYWCDACGRGDTTVCTDRVVLIPAADVNAARQANKTAYIRGMRIAAAFFAVFTVPHVIAAVRADTAFRMWFEVGLAAAATGVTVCCLMAARARGRAR
jgi:hypothetical protein